jgi:two-component system, cell cycle sensor histidine kinase and response regulator CckA
MKVILMSGYAEDVFREEISRDTTIHFLAKPFSLKTLASTVKSVLVE